jgi:heme o synthase
MLTLHRLQSTSHRCLAQRRNKPQPRSFEHYISRMFSTSNRRDSIDVQHNHLSNKWRHNNFFTDNQTLNNTRRSGPPRLASTRTEASYAIHSPHTDESTPPPSSSVGIYKPVPPLTVSRTFKIYSQLAKTRLTFLVVLTAMSGVALSPLPASIPVLLSTALGTTLCSAAANTFNQISEVPFDAQMARTRNRPLVRKAISPLHAACFGVAAGVAGPALLLAYTNPLTALLGLGNIVLYSGVYTALKRRHVVNTWVGAIVGGIPPLMGWAACGGSLLPSPPTPMSIYLPSFLSSTEFSTYLANNLPLWTDNLFITTPVLDNPLAPLILFLFHYSWQFPHFNSLSYVVRSAYAQAGYSMLSVTSPSKNALVSLRHTVAMVFLTTIFIPLSGITTWAFAVTSLVPNAVLLTWSWRFWRYGGEKTAKVLFGHSLWYLPAILGLAMYHKRGMDWTRWLGLSSGEAEKEEKPSR